ncbi:MAG: hypothetical protein JXR73_07245 [Candidatus Omnitrophica bacterium]|nr:hypothetical protein [Candidatus Omnitrophota bacterium]
MMKYFWGKNKTISIVGIFFFFFCYTSSFIRYPKLLTGDGDLSLHVRIGAEIAQAGQWPEYDPILKPSSAEIDSFRDNFFMHEWLFEYLSFVIHHYFSWSGLLILGSLLISTLMLWVVQITLKQHYDWWVSILLLFYLYLGLQPFCILRPHIVTWLFLFLWYIIWIKWLNDQFRTVWTITCSSAVMILWINFHGGFIYGLIFLLFMLGSLLIQMAMEQDIEKRSRLGDKIKTLSLALLIIIAASCINPNHISVYKHFFLFTQKKFLFENHLATQPLNINDNFGKIYMLYILLGLILLQFHNSDKKIFSYTIFLGMCLLPLKSIRHAPNFLIVTILPIMQSTNNMLNFLLVKFNDKSLVGKYVQIIKKSSKKMRWLSTPRFSTPSFLSMVAVLVIISWIFSPVSDRLPSQLVPLKALSIMKEEPVFHTTKGFNDFTFGGYMAIETPECTPFIHSLTTNFPVKRTRIFCVIIDCRFGWKELFLKENFVWVLIGPKSILNKGLSELDAYRIIHEDSLSVLYLHKDYLHLLEDPKFDSVKKLKR